MLRIGAKTIDQLHELLLEWRWVQREHTALFQRLAAQSATLTFCEAIRFGQEKELPGEDK